MLKQVNPAHILGIDALRFLAALMVVLFHLLYLTGVMPQSYSGWASGGHVVFPEAYAWSHFGWVGVQIFFVISGFVIAYSASNATAYSFFSGRVVRLVPGVWICATVTLAVTLALECCAKAGDTLMSYLNSVMFSPFGTWMDGTYWTLGIEIAFYTLVLAFIAARRFGWVLYLAMAMGTASAIFWVVVTVAGGGDGALAVLMARLLASRKVALLLLPHGVFFGLGVLLWWELTVRHRRAHYPWMLLFIGAGCLQIIYRAQQYNLKFGVDYSPTVALGVWLAALVAMVLSVRYNSVLHRAPQALLRALRMAGLMTFPLYLLHQVNASAVMGLLAEAGWPRWGAFAAALLCALVASWLVAAHLEPALQKVLRAGLARLRPRQAPAAPDGAKL